MNALSLDMTAALLTQLAKWRSDAAISHVVIASTSPWAFCAGGDVRYAREMILAGDYDAVDVFFKSEYQADLALDEFGKPVIALCDGVVMGGGAGIAQHCSHIIVTETTRFAMPESSIGLFPDVGASLFLGRCPTPVARLLGMVGHIINGADCLVLGLATTLVETAAMPPLMTALLACDGTDIDDLTSSYRCDLGPAPLQAHIPQINHIFADGITPVEMHQRARDLASLRPHDKFVAAVLEAFDNRCPMSMMLFWRLLDVADGFTTPSEAIALDYHLAMRMTRRADFIEGIRALLVDKDHQPKWSPTCLSEVDAVLLNDVFDEEGLPPLR